MPEPNPKQPSAPAVDQTLIKQRIDTFALGILSAEVQRKGIGLSIGALMSVKKLAEQMVGLLG